MNIVSCYKESGFPLLPEITIKNEQNKVVVRKVPVDGDFAKFGVKEGDVIESVNGISFKGFDNNKVFSTLSVMTGDLKIVFDSGVKKESLTKSKRRQKTSSSASSVVKEKNQVEELPDVKKVKKEPKASSKRKKDLNNENESSNEKNIVSESVSESISKTAVKEIESILDATHKRRKIVKDEEEKVLPLEEKLKEETVPTSLEECPECDDKFNSITALSEHYTLVHTVVTEEEEPVSPTPAEPLPAPKAKLSKKEKRKSSKKDQIQTQTVSVSEQFAQKDSPKLAVKEEEDATRKDKPDGSKKEEELKQLHDKLKDMKAKFDNFKNDRMELIGLKKKMESNKDLENSLKGLKDEVDKKYKEMSDMKNMVLNAEKQLDNETQLNKKEKDRNKALTEEIKKLKKNQSEFQKKIKELESKNREYLAKECKEVDANNESNEKFKEMEEEVSLLNKKVKQLSKENDSLVEETMRKVQKEKEVLQNTIDEKIIEVDKLKNDKSLGKMKIRNLEKQMEGFKSNAEKQMEAFKSNAQEIQVKIASMTTDQESSNKDLQETVETQNNKVIGLENDLKVSNEKVIKYKRDVSKLLEKISRKEDVIDGLLKEKKEAVGDDVKKEQIEKKVKTYQETILQKSGIISKLEEENQKLLKEKIDNLPLNEEKKKTRNLEDNLRKVERLNREWKEKFRTIEIEKDEKQIKDKVEHQQDLLKTKEIENKLKDLEKEAATYEQKVQKLTNDKERLEEILESSTMEAEEKNLLNILKSDVKNLEATNELNLEKIIALEMENEKLKSSSKDGDIVSLQLGIRDLERENEELKAKCKDLEDENRDTLNDQYLTMTQMKEKMAKLKERKRELKEDLEEESKKADKMYAKNKILQREVGHMSQLQVELKSLKQKMGIKLEEPEIVDEVVKDKSKWDNDSDASSVSGEEDNDDWKIVNDTMDEVMNESERKKNLSEISDDETDFDSTKFLELAKNKASETETSSAFESDNVVIKLNRTPKVNPTVRKAISDMLATKDVDDETRDDKFKKEDHDIRRAFGDKFADKFSLDVKNNRSRFERSHSANRAGRGGYERNHHFSGRGRDRDARGGESRGYKANNFRENYYESNSMSNRNTPGGSYSNFHRRVAERDVDIRYPQRRFSPQDRRNVNDPRRWRQDTVSYAQRASLNTSALDKFEETRAPAEPISLFVDEKSVERSPSMDKPSTSTVSSSKSAVLSDLGAHIKRSRNSQTEAKFDERNVSLTENDVMDDHSQKKALEDGEVEDFVTRKRFKPSTVQGMIPKFRPSQASRNEIRSL